MEENVKTEKRSLRYDFTASEIHDLSIELAQKNKECVSLENEGKAVQSQYASKIKVVKSEIAKLSNQVSDGWEIRDIECDVVYHKPAKGKKTITRKDTGRSYVEPMESWEWNLFNQADDTNEEETGVDDLTGTDEDNIEDAGFSEETIEDNGPKLLGN